MNMSRRELSISERELAEMEEYISTIWSFVPIPIAFITPLGIIIDANKAMEELLQLPRSQIVAKSVFDYFCETG